MTALWTFYAVPEKGLRQVVDSINEIAASRDLGRWKQVYSCLASTCPRSSPYHVARFWTVEQPVTRTSWYSAAPDLPADVCPLPGDPSLLALFRELLPIYAEFKLVSRDSRPGLRLRMLRDDGRVSDSEEASFNAWMSHFFESGMEIEEPLAFLNGGDVAATALVGPDDLEHLLRQEAGSAVMSRLARELQEAGDLLGTDIEALLHLARLARLENLSLYYWEPGT